MSGDFLDRICRVIAEAAREGGPRAVLLAEIELRKQYGGKRPYIPKTVPQERLNHARSGAPHEDDR
ncbi:MAG TPA: hypothetical protein VF814_05735 [Casimicrobiaceae bacterium]